MSWGGFTHDRGRILVDVTVLIAGGSEAIADIEEPAASSWPPDRAGSGTAAGIGCPSRSPRHRTAAETGVPALHGPVALLRIVDKSADGLKCGHMVVSPQAGAGRHYSCGASAVPPPLLQRADTTARRPTCSSKASGAPSSPARGCPRTLARSLRRSRSSRGTSLGEARGSTWCWPRPVRPPNARPEARWAPSRTARRAPAPSSRTQSDGRPSGRVRQRTEPDRRRGALPPGRRYGRIAHRIRRQDRSWALAARLRAQAGRADARSACARPRDGPPLRDPRKVMTLAPGRNRVHPRRDLHAVPAPGTFTGNRNCVTDGGRRWAPKMLSTNGTRFSRGISGSGRSAGR
jgi:hypothetical protein